MERTILQRRWPSVRWGSALWLGAGLAACSPALDWRETRPANAGLTLLMPCKPQLHERQVLLVGSTVRMALHACTAGEQTWALAFADVGDPQRLGAALQALAQAATGNVNATSTRELALVVPGATPHGSSKRAQAQGQLADGQTRHLQFAVFAHGTRVFQATALGPSLQADAAQTFMESIRFAP